MSLLEIVLQGLAWLILIGYLLTLLEFAIGNRSIRPLAETPPAQGPLPKVSVIIPARNEARHIREALTSVLHLDYPDYEIMVLNDRSTDKTGEILDEMSQQYPQLRVVHIETLPPGWLGKNHALNVGAGHASGQLLLFTDADIVMEASALRRAVACFRHKQLDHLTLMPQIKTPSFWLDAFVGVFTIFFSLYARPWRARHPKSKFHIGVGAFNLISAETYRQIGTHQAIAMRPDDDIKLGKLVKKHGFRQDVVKGAPLVQVEWYASIPEMVDGLMKNAFAGIDYNLPYLVFGVLMQFLFSFWPVIAFLYTTGLTQLLYALILLLMFLLALDNALIYRHTRWSAPLFPFLSLLMMYVIVRSAWLTLENNGISWRNTHYPLSELKANRV